jgi:hypothetical protein
MTSCLHVPEIRLVVAGDGVYNDVHLHLSESDHKGRLDWLAALLTFESLHSGEQPDQIFCLTACP